MQTNCTIYFDCGSSSGAKIQNSQEALALVSVINFGNKASIKRVINNSRSSRVKFLKESSLLLIDNMVSTKSPTTHFNLICRHYNLFNEL